MTGEEFRSLVLEAIPTPDWEFELDILYAKSRSLGWEIIGPTPETRWYMWAVARLGGDDDAMSRGTFDGAVRTINEALVRGVMES